MTLHLCSVSYLFTHLLNVTRENSVLLIFACVLIALSIDEFILGYKFCQDSQSKQMWYFLGPLWLKVYILPCQ